VLRDLVGLQPNNPELRFSLGADAEEVGRGGRRLPGGHPPQARLRHGTQQPGRRPAGAGEAGAVAAFREALRLQPDYPEAHFNLGLALHDLGRFREALASLRDGHELGSRRPGWPAAHTAAVIRQVGRLAELDRDLPAFLSGQRQPSGPAEQVELASFCSHPAKRLYAAAARFYADALTAGPALGDDLRLGHRDNAACIAALAGCGGGEDKPSPSAEGRALLRQQALGWLKADLAAWATLAQKTAPLARQEVRRALAHWRRDADLAGVREPAALAKLPADERREWEKLWADVAALLTGAGRGE
jgi:tetratricopeptide (TPR) repeat protein